MYVICSIYTSQSLTHKLVDICQYHAGRPKDIPRKPPDFQLQWKLHPLALPLGLHPVAKNNMVVKWVKRKKQAQRKHTKTNENNETQPMKNEILVGHYWDATQ